jgi:hypothetical protein
MPLGLKRYQQEDDDHFITFSCHHCKPYLILLPPNPHPTNMQPYRNLGGSSGVAAFFFGDRHIDIEFQDGHRYRYDSVKPGQQEVEAMKALAKTGKGLATFINQHVRERFAVRLR